MNPVQSVFPKYTAAVAQVGVHGRDAATFAKDAWQAPDTGVKLDNAWRSYNSFDHAVEATEVLPLDRLVPGVGKYRMGYEAARTAAHLIIASGAVPGARERVGKQELLAAQQSLHLGVSTVGSEGESYDRYRALDYLGGSVDDATNGLVMLRKGDVALPLLRGLSDVRDSVAKNRPVDPTKLQELDKLFASAGSEFDSLIAEAGKGPVVEPTPDALKALKEADVLLREASLIGADEA